MNVDIYCSFCQVVQQCHQGEVTDLIPAVDGDHFCCSGKKIVRISQ